MPVFPYLVQQSDFPRLNTETQAFLALSIYYEDGQSNDLLRLSPCDTHTGTHRCAQKQS
jgi:hypothetical protein